MCGIVGILSFDGNVESWHGEIRDSVDLMVRRGPDDEGIWSDEHACILGARRLAILDPSPAGHQPMLSPDGRYALVFNGEIYNFRELRGELQREGISFRSTGDTEVVLHALARWGVAALEQFNGMFALGFYDALERQVLLARDHAGIKPLYYLLTPQGLFFASQYDQILAHSWARERTVDPERLAIYLELGYLPAPYAMLHDTNALEPGSWMAITEHGRVTRGRHFTFPVRSEPDLCGEMADEAVAETIRAAVQRHMVSDVPVGVFLSGGIDSPLVAAEMAHAAGELIPAFTLGTDGGEFDESEDASKYANQLRLDHRVCHMTPSDGFSMLEDVLDACGEPLDDYSIFPTMRLSKFARAGVKVILSGDGGDELFWGYTRRHASFLRTAWHRSLPERWLSNLHSLRHRVAGGNTHGTGAGGAYLARQRFVSRRWLSTLFPELPPWPAGCGLFEFDGSGLDRLAQWARWNEYTGHLTRVLLKVDRASMFHSLEVRVPLLDREVVNVASRIDWRSCLDVNRDIGKRPLRAALARHARFQTEAKRGFTVPMAEWLRGPFRPVFEELVAGRSEILGLPLRQEALRRRFRRHLNGEADYKWGLWRLLSLRLWEQGHYRSSANCV